MKKAFFAAAVCLGMFSLSAAVESFRLELNAVKDMTIAELAIPRGTKLAVQKPNKEVKEGITRAYIYSDKLSKEWKKYTLSFLPEEDGRVMLVFQTPGSSDVSSIKPVLIDDVQVTGGKFKNGNFETVANGKFANWRMNVNAGIVTVNAAEGKNCAQVSYNKGSVAQAIYVTADEKVTVSFQARLAD